MAENRKGSMGRYVITLKDGTSVGADDARFDANGQFLTYVTRYEHQTVSIPSSEVKKVEKVNLGWQGGMRFTGDHDSSFSKTPGSI